MLNDVILTDNDCRIFKSFRCIDTNSETKGLCKGDGVTVAEIVKQTGLSERKVRETLKLAIQNGLVAYGIMKVRTKTYYLTLKGVKEITSMMDISYLEEDYEEE